MIPSTLWPWATLISMRHYNTTPSCACFQSPVLILQNYYNNYELISMQRRVTAMRSVIYNSCQVRPTRNRLLTDSKQTCCWVCATASVHAVATNSDHRTAFLELLAPCYTQLLMRNYWDLYYFNVWGLWSWVQPPKYRPSSAHCDWIGSRWSLALHCACTLALADCHS